MGEIRIVGTGKNTWISLSDMQEIICTRQMYSCVAVYSSTNVERFYKRKKNDLGPVVQSIVSLTSS